MCGTLLRLKEGEKYEEHSHSTILQAKPVGISSMKLAPLAEKECLLLDAIASPEVRYNVHTSPCLLEWAVGLKEGETVLARLSKHSSDDQDCLRDGSHQVGRGHSSEVPQQLHTTLVWSGDLSAKSSV